MRYTHKGTNFFIADPHFDPLQGARPTHDALIEAYTHMIISASGWRKVFAPHEEDDGQELSITDSYLVALAAHAFACSCGVKEVVIGMDCRPTGPAIAHIVCRILLAHNISIKHVYIATAGEIMAHSAYVPNECFFYISASHNPIGHNGFKFGKQGGVFTAQEGKPISDVFNSLLFSPDAIEMVQSLSAQAQESVYATVLASIEIEKEQALHYYRHLIERTITGEEDSLLRNNAIALLREEITLHPIGIVGELNGSARSLSIDKKLLEDLSIRTHFINDTPRHIVHGIVPEGENLQMCQEALQASYTQDTAFQLGYVPDNDGDRGNIVYIDTSTGKARILAAQELFALVALIELSLTANTHKRYAIAVNGPTSLMIDQIATSIGVEVFRAEVGEANVVQLAQNLRDKGYIVRLLGEGSNGGNITYPCKVRDPLNTLFALVKLLSNPTRFAQITKTQSKTISISEALKQLPKRTITGSFSSEGVMKVKTVDHGVLKRHYEALFLSSFEERKSYLAHRFGIYGWEERQTEGTEEKIGMGDAYRSEKMRGGLKIIFTDKTGNPTDFIWMRGSGTEPVFRVMADALGEDQERHDYLLQWQRNMVERADAM